MKAVTQGVAVCSSVKYWIYLQGYLQTIKVCIPLRSINIPNNAMLNANCAFYVVEALKLFKFAKKVNIVYISVSTFVSWFFLEK